MKKSTDTIIRIFFIIAIFGAIGHYYYQKFKHPVAPMLKSEIIKLPKETVSKNNVSTDNYTKKIVKRNIGNDNTSVKNIPAKVEEKKTYSLIITGILKNSNLSSEVYSYIHSISKNAKVKMSDSKGVMLFKRVLIGPYSKKTEMIKAGERINSLKIESIRLKIKGNYYIHVGSFSNENKLNEFVDFLRKHGFNNIAFMNVKVPKTFVKIEAENLDNATLNKITDFLKKNNLKFKITE